MAPSSPQEIGRYRVLTELGQGGTANVYLAVSSALQGFNKLVVLKRMKPQLASEPGFASMFLDEARLAARLAHPNIVQTYEVISDDELPVIVMEYLEGQTLANIIARSSDQPGFELHHHLAIISEALTGLEYSHDLRDFDDKPLDVVHRDVTPHNVFVTFDGQVKVLDFGIAKLSGSLVETESGVIKGKLRYIPPEQIVNEGVDRRADVYSVGVMLWEAATRDKMWRGLSEATIMNRVINGEIPRPSDVKSGVSPELQRIVMKALAPEREKRHESAHALQLELDAFRRTLPQTPTARDLGPLVEELFRAEREQRRRTIEEHLGAEHLGHPAERRTADDATPASYALPDRARPDGSRALAVGAVLVVVAGALTWLEWPKNPVASSPPAPTLATARAADPGRERIELSISAAPETAVISLDGVPRGGNPARLFVERDGSVHEVRATAPGYDEAVASVRFDRNRTLVLRLSKQPTQQSTPTSSPPAAPELRAPPAHKPAPRTKTDDCDPPFTIDERGIKRFKPDCVR
jgi:serine/threonine-protein kinase